jgi:hypothetical protein
VNDLNALVEPYLGLVVVILALGGLVLLAMVIVLLRRTSRLDRRLQGVTRGSDGQSLETILEAHLDKVDRVARELDEVAARAAILEQVQRRGLQRIGLVRFNPFEDTGGNQSFALAVLDAHGNGFVVSSLHARAGTRVYGKSVSAGKSESNLSAEEAEALRLALGAGSGTATAG